jgi:hypothetical protein
MKDIFEIEFSFEQKMKDEIIVKFSTKQGGDFNVFSYHWQCFAWAAVIGFFYEKEPLPLQSKKADQPFNLNTMRNNGDDKKLFGKAKAGFNLNTMRNNGGDKVAQALLCMCIAKAGTLDILKEPGKAISLINGYANDGFHYIQNIINGKSLYNDLEIVKQEIFGRKLKE